MKQNRKILSVALLCVAIVCLILAGIIAVFHLLEDKQSEEALDALRVSAEPFTPPPATDAPSVTEAPTVTPETIEATPEPLPSDTPAPTAVPNPYAESFLANEDMVGWLLVPGTNIDYPVMWTPEDENYYLYRDFDGSDNSNGSLILDTDSSLNPLTTNLIIHGHNMKSGAMFGNLTDYEDPEYFKEHKQIILHTKECQRNYEIIAVFRSQVFKKTDNVFKFYKFFQADTQEEFDDFYNNIKELSLYDTGVTAEFGDHFITLSTCVYHVTNGRFVVVAKEIAPGASYQPIER